MSILMKKSEYHKKGNEKKKGANMHLILELYSYIWSFLGGIVRFQDQKTLELEKLCTKVFCNNFVIGPTCPS